MSDPGGQGAVTLDGLAERGHDFATIAETAHILRVDPRTIRRRCADGTIPATRAPGDWRIPVSWLREQVAGDAR